MIFYCFFCDISVEHCCFSYRGCDENVQQMCSMKGVVDGRLLRWMGRKHDILVRIKRRTREREKFENKNKKKEDLAF